MINTLHSKTEIVKYNSSAVLISSGISCLYKKSYCCRIILVQWHKNRRFFYNDNWHIFKALKGVWYEIYPKETCDKNYRYDKEFFDFENLPCGGLEDIADNFTQKRGRLICLTESFEIVQNIIDFYLDCSPIEKVAVMIRIQDKECEAILGTMRRSEFVKRLAAKKLRFNVLYFVQKDEISANETLD